MTANHKALAVVSVTVLLQLLGAALLKQAAIAAHGLLFVPAALITAAFGVQGVRFLLWGYAHRHWPLSMTYPMTAVFFPLLIGLAAWYGERVSLDQWLGGLLITGGVAWITFSGAE